jgi:hypothetical protein
MEDPSVKAKLIQNDPLESASASNYDESWMDTPLNNGIREITVRVTKIRQYYSSGGHFF